MEETLCVYRSTAVASHIKYSEKNICPVVSCFIIEGAANNFDVYECFILVFEVKIIQL